ncbi:MAG: protein kinase, partial [Clostridia bacterium]|nr:protein kinase [Clostridia bacterium]
MEDFSLSNTLSKGSVFESDSIYRAYQDDAMSWLADGARPEAISNEEIHQGDVLLETYTVEDDAIHGGMGSVWRVHHNSWNTDLAMKRPQPRFFAEGSERRKEEFIAECEHWINLGLHPNIVSCYYVREIGGVPTIFSEWMDGGSLKDAIQSGRLYEGTEQEVRARILDIAIQTARGLKYSHENGLIHQDVKPGN